MNRSHYLKTRLSPAEHAILKARAGRKGMTVSEYVRVTLFVAKDWHREPPTDIVQVAISPVLPELTAVAVRPVSAYAFERKNYE